MQFGCCVPLEHAHLAAEMGFDFVELRVAELTPDAPAEAFAEVARRIEAIGVPTLACNLFVPPELPIVGPAADPVRLAD